MTPQMLSPGDRSLLHFIRAEHAAGGPLERAALSVKARGNGLEVARALLTLKAEGLVEEYIERPGLLRRLFGAQTRDLIRPTEAGLAWHDTPAAAPAAAAAPPGPATDAAKTETPEPAPAPASESLAAQETPVTAPEEPTEEPTAAPIVEPVAETAAETAPELTSPTPLAAPESDETSAADEAAARSPASTRSPAPAHRPAPRPRLDAFTEDLGGVPLDDTPAPVAAPVPADVLDGLRETLGLQGMELTTAGEMLIADRIAKGASQGEALSQVVLFAFAHAVHFSTPGGSIFQPGALRTHAIAVMHALEALRDAGEIGEARFEADMRALWAMVGDGPEAQPTAAAVLADPIGGMAPPALLPDDLLTGDPSTDEGF